MSSYRIEAICINRKKVNSSDSYLSLFSRQMGLIEVYAKNSNHPKNILNAGSQPFVYGFYNIYGKKTKQLNSVDIKENYYSLRENYDSFLYASLFSKIINISLPEELPNIKLFELFCNSVFIINKYPEKFENLLLYFLVFLTKEIGIGIQVENCSYCSAKSVYYDENESVTLCKDHVDSNFVDMKAEIDIIRLIKNTTLIKFINRRIKKSLTDKAKNIMYKHILNNMGINLFDIEKIIQSYKGENYEK